MKDGLSFVMGVNLIIWAGIAVYLFVLDRKIKNLEETVERKQVQGSGFSV